jgi:hypothetical protein
MSQPLVITREVTMTALGGAAPIVRAWAAPCSYPFRDVAIWISSRGQVTAALNLNWEVFYGGYWNATPFALTSTHAGGRSQGSGALAGAIEYADVLWEDASILPPNARITRPGPGGTDMGISGFPVVLQLSNQKASELTVWVTFICRDVTDPM